MEVLEALPDDCDEIVELFHNYRFALRYRQWLDWKYYSNPVGNALRFKITSGGRIVGAVAIIPQLFFYRGRRIIGLQTVDGILGNEIRGRGNFNYIMHFLMSQKPPGILEDSFYLSFPSLAVSVKAHENAGWHRLANFHMTSCYFTPKPIFKSKEMPILMKAMDILWAPYRKWLLGTTDINVRIKPYERDEVNFNDLLDKRKVCGVRSPCFIRWRVSDNPRDKISTFLIFKDDEWIGYSVCKINGQSVELLEIRLKELKQSYIRSLIRYIISNRLGDSIDIWALGQSRIMKNLPRIGFFRRSFSGALFVANHIEVGLPETFQAWDITYLDSDW